MTRSYEELISMDLVELAKVTMDKSKSVEERVQCWECLTSRMGEIVSGWGSYTQMERAMILAVYKCRDLEGFVAKHAFAAAPLPKVASEQHA